VNPAPRGLEREQFAKVKFHARGFEEREPPALSIVWRRAVEASRRAETGPPASHAGRSHTDQLNIRRGIRLAL
jgi:hypothetical protein